MRRSLPGPPASTVLYVVVDVHRPFVGKFSSEIANTNGTHLRPLLSIRRRKFPGVPVFRSETVTKRVLEPAFQTKTSCPNWQYPGPSKFAEYFVGAMVARFPPNRSRAERRVERCRLGEPNDFSQRSPVVFNPFGVGDGVGGSSGPRCFGLPATQFLAKFSGNTCISQKTCKVLGDLFCGRRFGAATGGILHSPLFAPRIRRRARIQTSHLKFYLGSHGRSIGAITVSAPGYPLAASK